MNHRWLASIVLLAGCPNPPPPTPETVIIEFKVPEAGAAPNLLAIPFPSDLYQEGDGTLQPLPGLFQIAPGLNTDGLAQTFGRLNGFGLTTGVFFPFSGQLDDSSLAASSVALLDITDVATVEIAADVRFDTATELLSITPKRGTVLGEGHKLVALVKGPLKDKNGNAIAADPALTEALGDAATNTGLSNARALLSPVVDRLIAEGEIQDKSELLSVTTYTTQKITNDLVNIQDRLSDGSLPAPQATFPDAELIFDTKARLDALLGDSRDANNQEIIGRDQAGGVAHAHVGVVASGFYPSVQIQPDDEGTNDDEQISHDANGEPIIINPARSLPFYIVLPDPAQSPMPVNGYPVVIWQHGLGGDRTAVWDSCDALAAQGFAVVAIDAINHGSRLPGATDTKNNLDRTGFLGDPNIKDGIAENTGNALIQFFESLLNLGAVRDNFRQSIVDLMSLSRLVREPSLDLSLLAGVNSPFAGTAIKLDASNVSYYGTSFGGILGGTFLAVDPNVRGGVLNVPGGALLIDLFSNSAAIGGNLLPNLKLLWGLSDDKFRFARDDIFMQIAQTVLEGGDPVIYGPHLIKDPFVFGGTTSPKKHLMVYEVIGDELVSNAGTEALAKAIGLTLGTPFYPGGPLYPAGDSIGLPVCDTAQSECDGLVGGITATLLQLSPATHGQNMSSHFGGLDFEPGFPFAGADPFPLLPGEITVTNKVEENVAAVNQFFQDLRDGVTPRITHPAPPVADFDDDGTDDAQDTAPTNPNIQ